MLKVLINGIFWLITKLADIIMSPFIGALMLLFPDVAPMFNNITNLLVKFISFIPNCLDIILVPKTAVILLFDYFSIKYSIYLLKIAINFAIKIYNKFKP